MKYKIKLLVGNILFYLMIININSSGQNINKVKIDNSISEFLIQNNFNIEIYELTYCIPELLYVLENDTTLMKVFNKRIKKAFNSQLDDASLYIHNIEFENFKKTLESNRNFNTIYPTAYKFISKIKPQTKNFSFNDYVKPFKSYIEYPEQVDDICIITLLYKCEEEIFKNILEDKIAKWRFNNWLEYGFEEFRYYPGTLNKTKGKLNERIINSIFNKCSDCESVLTKEALSMINRVVKKYDN